VGRGLVPYLKGMGHDVLSASRAPGADFVVSDVGPETDWSAALAGVEAVVHLAARAHILRDEAADPLAEHRRVNTEGSLNLAGQAAAVGISRFVFVSSIGVLGNNSLRSKNGEAFTESDEAQPHDQYSRSKWEAEEALAAIEGLDLVVVRPPLIYGAGVPGNLRKLVDLAKSGRPFPLGGVHNKRSLIGLRNLCSFLGLCLTDERAVGQRFVISDGEDVSTAELYSRICKHLKITPRLVNVPQGLLRAGSAVLGKGKMAERLCDTLLVDASKARNLLGWRPVRTMDEELEEMVRAG
jgi:nucleoside-diphosphate-sugar epimerase